MARKHQQPGIVRLSITLLYVEPKVARRMDVPADTYLDDLHLYIQAAMGWEDCHVWGFDARRYGRRAHWSVDDWGDSTDATLLDVIAFLQGNQECTYVYDYGDSWTHRIRIGKLQPERDDRRYPYLVSGTGRCPPEDIGGSGGYSDFLQALADPDSECRESLRGFLDGYAPWDPEDADLDARRRQLSLYQQ